MNDVTSARAVIDERVRESGEAGVERHGMKPVAVVFGMANMAVLAVFVGLVATGWLEFGVSAIAATPG